VKNKRPEYYLDSSGEFVVKNYNQAPTFASFFPGIAGVFGCPMWVFYANRGQAITSAGVEDKNGALIEFQPANKAFRSAPLAGFRTFLKIDHRFYEPFASNSPAVSELRISPNHLTLIEVNHSLKIKIEITYFTVPNESFPALARTVKIYNLAAKSRKLEVLDGLAAIVPAGFNDHLLKFMSQTIEAWNIVENLENKVPFYKLKVEPADSAETNSNPKGNFFLAFAHWQGQAQPILTIVDPSLVFGNNSALVIPERFISQDFSPPTSQQTQGFMPSALAYKKLNLTKSATFELFSLIGQADNLKALQKITKLASQKRFFTKKFIENEQLTKDLCASIKTKTSLPAFDLYARQTFLDNVMRGGLPVTLGPKTIYLYYRKHGDMERDYNNFQLKPTYFSQGTGNYRDINQNRRNDLFFNPNLAEDNIVCFFNLIQLDGFNPLVVLGSQFFLETEAAAKALLEKHLKSHDPSLVETLLAPFILGDLLKALELKGVVYKTNRQQFSSELLKKANVQDGAVHGEGFWTDHFAYNTDLLESFSGVFPDKLETLLFDQKIFTFFDNDHRVAKREEKYCFAKGKVRQYTSVKSDFEKQAQILNRDQKNHRSRTNFGKGPMYHTTLIAKIICLVANKAASFDAEGIGLEMEADKPNWYDALNGLPGLFGSSLSETLELKRLCEFTHNLIKEKSGTTLLAIEIKDFVVLLSKALSGFLLTKGAFEYWEESYQLKENFRSKVRFGIAGQEAAIALSSLAEFLENVIKKCNYGISKCQQKYGTYYTYFINKVSEHEMSEAKIRVKDFKQTPLPLFLEGFVHALKVEKDKSIYQTVKASPLYDKALKMYKVNAPLDKAPLEIGRCKIFIPGWLENESIWLHMEYKYLLELLKAGLYKEFFADFKNVLIPFLAPETYKRSTLENSSFLVSSAHPDKTKHGQGFVARLSGACAEFIDIWVTMMAGKNIFYLNEANQLCFKLSPILPNWLFDKGQLSFTLLGSIEVSYSNPKGQDTFAGGVAVQSYTLTLTNSKKVTINTPFVPEPYASLIRNRQISKIVAHLL